MATDSNIMPIISKPDKYPLPIFPPGFFDANKNSLELIIMVVLSTMGMGSVEYNLYGLSQDQPAADKVRNDEFNIANLLTEIENESTGKGGATSGDLKQLIKDIKQLFGKGGDLDKMAQQLLKSGQNPTQIADMVNSLKDEFNKGFADSPKNEKGDPTFTKYPDFIKSVLDGDFDGNSKTNTTNFTNALNDLNKFAANFYYNANPTEKPKDKKGNTTWSGGNWLSTWYTNDQSGQQGLQGLSSQFTAMVQQDSTMMSSYQQTGQQMLQVANQLKMGMVQNQKSS